MEAYRYPEDYDAISAMAPANQMVPLMVMSLWTGAATEKDPASSIPLPKYALVQKAVLEACDANDGVKDGIITSPPACHFDPAALQCKNGDAPDCLTAPQVTALRAIYAGPKNPRTGKQIYPGLSVGGEAQMPVLTMGKEPFPVATSFFRGPVFNDPSWDFRSFDYDRDTARAMAYGSDALDVPPTGLKRFFAGNRKLLLSHGWADGLIPSQSTVNFYQALVKDIGAREARADVRLFMVPGMGHCGQQPARPAGPYPTTMCLSEDSEIFGARQHGRCQHLSLRGTVDWSVSRCQAIIDQEGRRLLFGQISIESVTARPVKPPVNDRNPEGISASRMTGFGRK
jgi:hypothetical protein